MKNKSFEEKQDVEINCSFYSRKTWRFSDDPKWAKQSWKSWNEKKRRYSLELHHCLDRIVLSLGTFKKKTFSYFLLMWRWNTETALLKGEKSTVSLNHLHQRRRNSASQHQWCVYNLFFQTLVNCVCVCMCKSLLDGFGQCWVYVALVSLQ